MQRRDFIKTATLLGSAGMASLSISARKKKVLGIQLYSLQKQMIAAPAKTLEQLAQAGYKVVEHAKYDNSKFYNLPIAEFKTILKQNGMTMPSGHSFLESKQWDPTAKTFKDTWKKLVDDAAEVGMKYVVSPWMEDPMRKDLDKLKYLMDVFNECGKLCQSRGMKFGYHNHNFETPVMLEGKSLYEHIIELTDHKTVVQQIDIGNMIHGEGNPTEWMKKYPEAFELMHVKDLLKSEDGHSCTLGTGKVDLKGILETANKTAIEYFLVEHESFQGKDELACVTEDHRYMKGLGY